MPNLILNLNTKLSLTLNAIHTWSIHASFRNANLDEFEHFMFSVAIF